jgi:endonuclease YncB( thermonuclease family)
MKRYILIVAIAVLFLSIDVKAASLFGKVIDVSSGDVITVFNLNRPVRVKLLGVDAPEMDQAFGDVAKKHLSDLVYDKLVLVEYAGISGDGSLAGRVLLNGSDIGAQMLRDGAAWFDSNNLSHLSATDRDVYQHSEQAARSERRGLWETENPIAPWEFVKGKQFKREPVASSTSTVPVKAKSNRPVSELNNLTIMTRGIAAAPAPSTTPGDTSAFEWASAVPTSGSWRQLKPAGENFSILVPENGKQTVIPVVSGDVETETHVYVGHDGWSTFGLTWFNAPTYGETDKVAINGTLNGFLSGVSEGYRRAGKLKGLETTFVCQLEGEKNISTSGFTGSEFELKSCTVPGRARAFTRVVDGQRQMYVAVAFYMEDDANVTRFLNSFTVTPTQKTRKR